MRILLCPSTSFIPQHDVPPGKHALITVRQPKGNLVWVQTQTSAVAGNAAKQSDKEKFQPRISTWDECDSVQVIWCTPGRATVFRKWLWSSQAPTRRLRVCLLFVFSFFPTPRIAEPKSQSSVRFFIRFFMCSPIAGDDAFYVVAYTVSHYVFLIAR